MVEMRWGDICMYRRSILCVRIPHIMGKYIGRPSVVGFLLHRIGFNPRIVHVEFLVYTVAQEEIDFILPAVIHQYIIVVCHRG